MTSPLSINGKPAVMKDWLGCRTFLKDLQPSTVVLGVDQPDQFNHILEAKNDLPNTKIVARFIDKDHDGSMHLKPTTNSDEYIVSPEAQLARTREYGRNGMTAYFGNEPDTKASIDDLNRLAAHTIKAMDLAATSEYDMSLTILNLGIGHPKPVNGFLPTWMHPILLKLNAYRDRHYYGLHLYLPMDILEHLLALKKTCDEVLHIPMPRCIVTEFGFDDDGVPGLNGFKSRGISNEAFAAICISIIMKVLRLWIEMGVIIGVAAFIYGDNASWGPYNVETGTHDEVSTAWRDSVLKAKLAGDLTVIVSPLAPTINIPPVAEKGTPTRIAIQGSNSWNLRIDHTTAAKAVGSIMPNEQLDLYMPTITPSDGHNWYYIERVDVPAGESRSGWIAYVLPVAQPPVIVPPVGTDPATDPDPADTIPVSPAPAPELPSDDSFIPVFEALIAMPPIAISKEMIPCLQAMADNFIIEARVKIALAQWIKSSINRTLETA